MAPSPRFGTAPHRIGTTWFTYTGRKLTPAGQHWWDTQYRLGVVTLDGHINKSVAATVRQARSGPTPAVRQAAGKRYGQQAQAQQEELLAQGRHGWNPATWLNPGLAVRDIGEGIKHRDPLQTGLGVAAILPGGRIIKPVREGVDAVRAVGKIGEATTKSGGAHAWEQAIRQSLSPEEQLNLAMSKAKPGLHEKMKTAARQKNIAAAEESGTFWKHGGGEAGYRAELGHHTGALPRPEFNHLMDMPQEQVDHLVNLAKAHPDLKYWEKNNTVRAILDVKYGKHPTEGQRALIGRVFGEKAAAEFANQEPLPKTFWNYVGDVFSYPKTVRSIGDLSLFFRQTIMALAHNPGQVLGKIPTAFHMAFSDDFYQKSMAAIIHDPLYNEMKRSGLELPRHDERFLSDLASKTPVLGKLVRASDRGFTGPANLIRSESWKDLYNIAALDGPVSDDRMKSIARFVNWSTGRGDIGRLGGDTPRKIINGVLWSPGLLKSRLDIFNPGFYNKLERPEQILVAKTLVKLVVGGSAVLGGVALAAKQYGGNVKVGYDPRSADFGKIRWGNSHIDVFGGNQQIVRAAAQIIKAEKINTSTGELQHLGGGFGQSSRFDVGLNYLIGKESPVASLVTAKARGRGFNGQPFSWKHELSSWKMPLLWDDIISVVHNDPHIAQIVTESALGFFGVGIQSYGPTEPKGSGHYKDPFGTSGGGYSDPFANLDSGGGGYSDPFSDLGP